MSNATDMSTPVTRGELREELRHLATKADLEQLATKAHLEQLATKTRADLEQLATKADLEQLATKTRADLEQLATKADLEQLATETRADLEIWGGALAERIAESQRTLSAELAGHAKAHLESTSGTISVIDDKYKSLPDRVKRLEATVFPDKQR